MMKIALLAHLRHTIAPPFAGGMEAHSWHLAKGLVARGHDVTIFASGDSLAHLPEGVKLHAVAERHYDVDYPWHLFHGTETLNAWQDAVFERVCDHLRVADFDVIHNNTLHRFPPQAGFAEGLPMVTSLHVPPFDGLRRAVRTSASAWSRFTVTSKRQLGLWWPDGAPEGASVLYNGIDPVDWPFVAEGDGSAVWAGRITPTKGTHVAIRAAMAAGVPLRLFGAIENQDYFDREVRPFLGRDVEYGGHLDGRLLAREIGVASVMLFTPMWDEPFGLAAVEAMSCGLPIAATDMGAVREVICEAGRYALSDDIPALASALESAMEIPRTNPARRVRRWFTIDAMIDRAEQLYDDVRRAAPPRPAARRGAQAAVTAKSEA